MIQTSSHPCASEMDYGSCRAREANSAFCFRRSVITIAIQLLPFPGQPASAELAA
jgi:hypothetical protein